MGQRERAMLVDVIRSGQTINAHLSIHILKTFRKRFRRARCHKHVAKIILHRRQLTDTDKSENTGRNKRKSQVDSTSSQLVIQPGSCSLRFPPFWRPPRERVWEWWNDYWINEDLDMSVKFKLVDEGDRRCCFSPVQGYKDDWNYAEKCGL